MDCNFHRACLIAGISELLGCWGSKFTQIVGINSGLITGIYRFSEFQCVHAQQDVSIWISRDTTVKEFSKFS